jgi:hypothetical protein
MFIDASILTPREALLLVCFGTFYLIFAVAVVAFGIRFASNLAWAGIKWITPREWYCLARSITLLLALSFCLSATYGMKRAGLAVYYQIADIVRVAKGYDVSVDVELVELPEQTRVAAGEE